jgi:multiple sugar transport system permease protein
LGKNGFTWGLLTPVLIFFVVFNVIPLLWMIGLSFHRYVLTAGGAPKFIGLDNYVRLLGDANLWGSFSKTLIFMVLTVGLSAVIGAALGYFFWGGAKMPGRRLALTLLFTPMLLTPVSVGAFFRLMLDPNFGIISFLSGVLTGSRVDFLADPTLAAASVLMLDVWMWTPFMTLITLAALASVPQAELEAAQVDRLRWTTKVYRVILPHAKFILMLGVLLRTIDAFKTTDQVLLLTQGGPGSATELLGLRIYRLGFDSLDMGSASTVAVVALFVAIGFTSLYLYVLNLRKKEQL